MKDLVNEITEAIIDALDSRDVRERFLDFVGLAAEEWTRSCHAERRKIELEEAKEEAARQDEESDRAAERDLAMTGGLQRIGGGR